MDYGMGVDPVTAYDASQGVPMFNKPAGLTPQQRMFLANALKGVGPQPYQVQPLNLNVNGMLPGMVGSNGNGVVGG